MVELKLGPRTVDLPYTLRIPGVTEEMFDEWVTEDMRAELIDGVMIVHSPTSPGHDAIANFLRNLMGNYVGEKGLGELFGPDSLFRPGEGRRFGPDIFFIQAARMPRPRPEKQFEIVPDLIVEVLSRSNRDEDLEVKRPAYQEVKVPEIWFVDPDERQVIQDRRGRRRYTTTTISTGRVTSTVLPGFWVEVDWLWADPILNPMACSREILGES
jgi:Uma2 family endonuclease